MDMNTALEVAGDVSKGLNKFQDIVSKVFGPMWTKKQADAEDYSYEKKIELIRQNPDMLITFEGAKMSVRPYTLEEFVERTQSRVLAEQIREQINMETIFTFAESQVKMLEDASETPIDEDWLIRWMEYAKKIGTTEMQYIWGKILAGEIESPKSFSLRTLDVLRNLSKEEAVTFQKILPLIIKFQSYCIISQNTKILEKYDINYHDLLVLDECGLINMKSDIGINAELTKDLNLYSKKNIVFLKQTEETSSNLVYRVYPLTSAGIELYLILANEDNVQYITDIVKDIIKNNSNLKLEASIYKILNIDKDKTIHFAIEPTLVTKSEDNN